MYKHKSLKQSLCCLLLLCLFFGFSAGLFSANATIGSINSLSKNFELYNSGSTLSMQIQATAMSPFTVSTTSVPLSTTTLYGSNNNVRGSTISSDTEVFVQQDIIVMVRLANNTTSDLAINTGYCSFGATLADFSTTGNLTPEWQGVSYDLLGGNLFDVITTISSANGIQCRWNSEFTYNSGLIIPAKSVLYSQVIFHIYSQYTYATSSMPTADKFAKKISVINLNNLTSDNVRVITDFTLMNADYNSILELDKLDAINAAIVQLYQTDSVKLQNIWNKLSELSTNNHTDLTAIYNELQAERIAQSNELSNIQSEQQTTNSNITAQTEQQEQQYNEFSAGSDSSDSSNINGAISSGTDAVKQKMGLFSFFDGIVNSMSDILTSDHERHLVLPALDVPLPEETVHVWDRKEFDFEELENNFGALLTVVRFATVAVCYSVMISGAYNIFHKFIGVKDGDA